MSAEKRRDDDQKLTVSEREELEQLRAEKRQWIMERDIPKTPMAFWVKESNG